MGQCINCGAMNSFARVQNTPDEKFLLVPESASSFLPITGLEVNVFACRNCGFISLFARELLNQTSKTITK